MIYSTNHLFTIILIVSVIFILFLCSPVYKIISGKRNRGVRLTEGFIGTQASPQASFIKKLDNTNCVYGRITGGPGSTGNDYTYLGEFTSYEECAKSSNIPANAKAITYHNDKIGGWEKQCFSINDTNTQVPNLDYATCGIKTDLSFLKNEILNANTSLFQLLQNLFHYPISHHRNSLFLCSLLY